MIVWTGIIGTTINRSLYSEENIVGELCLNLLEEIMEALITNILENGIHAAGNMMEQCHITFFQLERVK